MAKARSFLIGTFARPSFRYNTPAMNSLKQKITIRFARLTTNGFDSAVSYVAKLALMIMMLVSCGPGPATHSSDSEPGLKLEFLLGSTALETPLPTRDFTPPESSSSPLTGFTGVLKLDPGAGESHFEVVTDVFSVSDQSQWKLTELPPFDFEFVSDGSAIIPLKQTPQRSDHPYWEIILGPGSAWSAAGDGDWSRAALPFALKEKNQNCTHNGMMTFAYKADGAISRVVWQISSETCLYLKINLWGSLPASYRPMLIEGAKDIVRSHRRSVSSRLPVRPVSMLAQDYPGLDQTAFEPPGIDDTSVYGLLMDGVHYRSDCQTRLGPYPFCDELELPSYSLAKSLVGSLAYQLLVSRWPGFASIPVSNLIPECKLPDGRWDDVYPAHLLDMTSGNYDSALNNADEGSSKIDTFFIAKTHDGKVRFSCEAWPRKSTPGTQWVYHTTDTYLLGVAMNVFLKQKLGSGADIYRDLLYPQFFEPLDLSPALRWTQRTYDETAQAFTGFGLMFNPDDIARLAQALNTEQISGSRELSMLPQDFVTNTTSGSKGVAYKAGFWAVDASALLDCADKTWLPFMVGYGGITVVMFPAGGVYYYFTDSNQFGFQKAAMEANKTLNYCE